MFPSADVSPATFSQAISVLTLMSVRTAHVNPQHFASTPLVRTSVNVHQELFQTHSAGVDHLTNVCLTMTAPKQQLATMANVKTHVRSLDPVELMPFAPQPIIVQCAPVHQEQMATHRCAAFLLSVSATLTATVRELV